MYLATEGTPYSLIAKSMYRPGGANEHKRQDQQKQCPSNWRGIFIGEQGTDRLVRHEAKVGYVVFVLRFPFRERFAQRLVGAMQSATNSADGRVEHLCDVFVCNAFDVRKHDDEPLFCRQGP